MQQKYKNMELQQEQKIQMHWDNLKDKVPCTHFVIMIC